MDAEISVIYRHIRPDECDKLLLANDLSRSFNKRN